MASGGAIKFHRSAERKLVKCHSMIQATNARIGPPINNPRSCFNPGVNCMRANFKQLHAASPESFTPTPFA
jgi:hypothetical protein